MAEPLRRDLPGDALSPSRKSCGVPPDEMARLLALARTIGIGVRASRIDAAPGL